VVGLDERFAVVENGTHHHAQREHVGENAADRRRLHLGGCKHMQIGRISRRERRFPGLRTQERVSQE
jgi:hypothetical protein